MRERRATFVGVIIHRKSKLINTKYSHELYEYQSHESYKYK